MIAIREIRGDEERFNWWLTLMPDILMNLSILPKEVRIKLDFTIDSLEVIETYLKVNYDLKEILQENEKFAFDLFSRYIGETFRKNLTNTIWGMETKEGWFGYGMPMLCKKNNDNFPKISPASLIGGVLDFNRPQYLTNILKFNIENEIKWEGRIE